MTFAVNLPPISLILPSFQDSKPGNRKAEKKFPYVVYLLAGELPYCQPQAFKNQESDPQNHE